MGSDDIFDIYLKPGNFTDSDAIEVRTFSLNITDGITDNIEKAVKLYYAVRDGFNYNPYKIDLRPDALKASSLLKRDHGYCVEKSNLLTAAARAAEIPSRLGYAIVKNHIGIEKLHRLLNTDILAFHGYSELYLDNKWIKATPVFNKELCQKLKVTCLEFDGKNDSIFQQYTPDGSKFMEYLYDYGHFHDVPYELYVSELKKYYPHLFQENLFTGDEYFIPPGNNIEIL